MKLRSSSASLVCSLLLALLFLPVASVRAAIDLNSNGISDVWELLNEEAVDPAGDADGDGQSNLAESIFGTNPMAAADSFHSPGLAWNQTTSQIDISWPSVVGKRYQLQTCSDLAAGEWKADGQALMGTGEILAVNRAPGSLAKLYLRVQVSDVDTDGDNLTNWEEITIGLDPNDRSNGTGNSNAGGPPPPPTISDVVTMRATQAFASEDGPASGNVTFSRPSDTVMYPLMVGYSVSGTATRGADHDVVNAWFSMPANQTTKVLDVNVLEDLVLESSESVTVTILWVISLRPAGSQGVLPGLPNRASVIINNSTAASGTGLLAQYYDTSSATYANSANFDPLQLKVTRVDPKVDFDWRQGTPNGNTQLASTDNYSVRWDGYLSPTTASYIFQLDADDKARVLLDLNNDGDFSDPGEQILENGWVTTATGTFKQSAAIPLTLPAAAANRYKISVEFVETTGSAKCSLQWKLSTATTFANIPSTNVFTNNTTTGNGWNASYYDSIDFSGVPGTAIDAQISTNTDNGVWGEGTPNVILNPGQNLAPVHHDSFSARWTGQVQPQFSEEYTFVVNCDDSAKLWVNGLPLTLLQSDTNVGVDWPTVTTSDRYARVTLVGGVRYDIRLEYLEVGGAAKCQLSWYSSSQPKQIIPSIRLYPASGAMQGSQQISSATATALVGALFSQNIEATNGATITLVGKPAWLDFTNGVLSGTPPAGAGGDYQILVTTTSAAGSGVSALNIHVEDNTVSPILREYWTGVTGTAVANIPLATNPTASVGLNSLETPTDFGDNYGTRIRGFITAPVTGNYYFWIAANNAAELWISNDEEPVNLFKRASVTAGSATPRNWNATAAQKSPWLAMEAGQKYYIEVLHKAGVGSGDNLAVGWLKPGQTGAVPSEVIPGAALSAYVPPAPGSNPGTLYIATLLGQAGAKDANGKPVTGVGTSTFRLSEDENSAIVKFSYSNLTGDQTDWHVHNDPYLTHGSSIMYDPNAPPANGSGPQIDGTHKWIFPSMIGTMSKAEVIELIKQGKAYINIHTALNPAGELRGNFTLASGSRTFTPPPAPLSWSDDSNTDVGAARFLTQATFGPNIADIAALKAIAPSGGKTRYELWIEDQFTKAASEQLAEVLAKELSDANGGGQFEESLTFNAWWRNSITGPDQLRQRMAFALSEIHVVSAQGPLDNRAEALSYFYDQLAINAFGNFRDILETTTLTPAMGRYLDMLRNDKPDQSVGRIPNENYGREIKQLFSIGLFRMWPDGTLILDSNDTPIVTYTQREIVGFAHVFTGWDYGYDGAYRTTLGAGTNWTRLMREVPARHFTGPKRVLNNEVLPGLATAAGQPLDPYATHSATQYNDGSYQALPAQELDATHDQLFNHPNVGPFICRQLIQRLVTSHPSRDYIYRVVQKFDNHGDMAQYGPQTRGSMKAVIKAILLDYEARSIGAGSAAVKPTHGKQREALLRISAPARAFRMGALSGTYDQVSGTHVINLTTTTAHKLVGGRNVYLDFATATNAPSDGIYTVLSTPAPSTNAAGPHTFSVNARGWVGISTSNGTTNNGISGTYSSAANSTTATITLSGHWLPAGGSAYLDFEVPVGTPLADGVYVAVTSTSTTSGGTTFTITVPTDAGARSGRVRMVGFRGSYTVTSTTGLPVGQEKRITLDTIDWVQSGNPITDHHLTPGSQIFLNFTAGNPQPTDGIFTVESVPDANTFTVLTSTAVATQGGNNDSDNGMWMFPLVVQPTGRNGNIDATASTFAMGNITTDIDQTPLNSPTVFNFFLPEFKFPGALASAGLTTPEFQDTAETTVIRQANFIYGGIFNPADTNGVSSFKSGGHALVVDFSPWLPADATDLGLGIPTDPSLPWTHNQNLDLLISQLCTLLAPGQISTQTKAFIRKFVGLQITSIATGASCTVTTAVPHGLITGDSVVISGVSNGSFSSSLDNTSTARTITVPLNSTNTFTINGVTCLTAPNGTGLANAHISAVPYNNGATNTNPSDTHKRDRIRAIIHMILSSPDYTIQR